MIYGRKTMEDLCDLAMEKDLHIINDEIYERITFDGCDYRNPLCYAPEAKEHILNINGVSKTYSMTGWRIGYALGSRELIKKNHRPSGAPDLRGLFCGTVGCSGSNSGFKKRSG